MVWQTQFRIWCSRPSLKYGIVDPFRILCSGPSLEYGVADPV